LIHFYKRTMEESEQAWLKEMGESKSQDEILTSLSDLMYLGNLEKATQEFKLLLTLLPVEMVSTTSVKKYGTLLQDAVNENKTPFVRLLLQFGADPTVVSKDCETPPLATAAKSLKDDGEMFRVMGELTEIPWLFKFERLRTLLCWEYNPPWVMEEFKNLLSTMPVDKVTSKNTISLNRTR